MKKKMVLLIIFFFLLSGCKNIEKELDILFKTGKGDYVVSDNFICEDAQKEGIKYLGNEYLVLNNGDLYEYTNSTDKVYSNRQKCKKMDTNIKVERLSHSLIRSDYFLTNNNETYSYNYQDKSVGLKKEDANIFSQLSLDVVRFTENGKLFDEKISACSDCEYYDLYVLKENGSLYDQIYIFNYEDKTYTLYEEKVLYSSEEYGKILDFFVFPEGSDKLITENGFFYEKEIENDECRNVIDVKCPIEMVKSQKYEEYKDDIIYINVFNTLLKNNMIINTNFFMN